MRYDAEKARERNEIGGRAAEARRALGMTQGEVAEALACRGVRVQTAAVSKWEKGDSVPNAYQLAALCDVLRLPMFADERLNEEGRRLLAGYRGYLESLPAYRRRPAYPGTTVEMNVSTLPASAGFGEALDNNLIERRNFPASSVPAGASTNLFVSSLFEKNGLSFLPDIEVTTIDLVIQAVEHDLGIATLPVSEVEERLAAGTMIRIPVAEPPLERRAYVITSKILPLSTAARVYLSEYLCPAPPA